jgi:hypothetical protein
MIFATGSLGNRRLHGVHPAQEPLRDWLDLALSPGQQLVANQATLFAAASAANIALMNCPPSAARTG